MRFTTRRFIWIECKKLELLEICKEFATLPRYVLLSANDLEHSA